MSTSNSIKSNLSSLLKYVAPRYYWNRKVNYYRSHFSEVEMNLLPFLCKKDMRTLDIGAAIGVFTANLVNYSKDVISFEPIPNNVSAIKDMIKYAKLNAAIECVAISNENGEAILSMLDNDLGLSTIEKSNVLENNTGGKKIELKVPMKRLDSYNLLNIGFIKIDVEGHEFSVVEGAIETIKNSKPALLIEIEERHRKNSLSEIKACLKEIGYEGFFVLERKLLPISEFDYALHQNVNNIGSHEDNYKRKGIYINNFIFIHSSESALFLKSAIDF